ncbi:tannase and feruloyl esterase [Lophiostoma macrostomum CBS 122681]|uniref:Carboxylic ester hydrolase n=1 Tax=Lophiostoma macrostomum CBS 122681 TaxID=1314788 RepID=A0A6A6SR09_9PLEO|nr:tannase and feruloyl esterase [Lophiostoma macrostomum CBS 122681]
MRKAQIFRTALEAVLLSTAATADQSCTKETFSDLSLSGGEILDIAAFAVNNFSLPADPSLAVNHYPEAVTGLSACGVNVTYTHAGQNDTINTWVWLPEDWNGRLMGVGGAGWRTGNYWAIPHAASKGFAAVATDGGHYAEIDPSTVDRNTWGLKSKGNVDWNLLQDFASITLDDAATLGKAAAKAFYGESVKRSYWNGCSTGGRQGHMMAQKYPHQYDGILATAPAINWERWLLNNAYTQSFAAVNDAYTPLCELNAFQAAAIEACDEIDGVKDGIIMDPDSCSFDAATVVGQSYNCSTGPSGTLSSKGASVFTVATSPFVPEDSSLVNGRPFAYGLELGSALWAVANTTCVYGANETSVTCTRAPFNVSIEWIQNYLAKDASFNVFNLTHPDYETLFRQSIDQYSSIIGASNPDLTEFKKAGGKLITWHGLADEFIPPNGTIEYWEKVQRQDPEVDDYYRLFSAPGVGHCFSTNAPGWYPGDVLDALINWVEGGVVPDTLEAKTVGLAKERSANLCKWPKRLIYEGGDGDLASSYSCA